MNKGVASLMVDLKKLASGTEPTAGDVKKSLSDSRLNLSGYKSASFRSSIIDGNFDHRISFVLL